MATRDGPPSGSEVSDLLLSGELAFAPLRVVYVRRPERESIGSDYVLELEWEGRRRRFGIEYKKLSTPKRLEDAIQQAKRNAVGDLLPMVVSPYFRPAALERLIETNTSGVDLSGNGVVIVPGEWLVFRSGEKNKYPARTPIRAIYAGKSSLVGRVLLLRSEFSSVTQVREEIGLRGATLSLGTVSKVLRALDEDLVIQRKPTISVLQPDLLIERLTKSFARGPLARRIMGRVEDRTSFLDRAFENARKRSVHLVGQSAAVYTAVPDTDLKLFTPAADVILQGTTFTETTRFPNVSVFETDDDTVYFDSRPSDGYLWTPPLQVYLTLANGGKREREIATLLRPSIEAARS